MKKLLLALSFAFLAVSSSYAERVVLTFIRKDSNDPSIQLDWRDITLNEGQSIQLTSLAGDSVKMKVLLGDFGSGSFPLINTAQIAADYLNYVDGSHGYFLTTAKGPCKVRITPRYIVGNQNMPYMNTGNYVWQPYFVTQFEGVCEYEITSTTTSSSSIQSISNTAIVVPSNAVGDVDVLLEQSNDMITWTQCLPGTYNASTQKRFFRVRAVEK